MLRTVGDQSSLWESILPEVCLGMPAELDAVDRLLDDPRFFEPYRVFFHPILGRPSIPMETYLRLMFLKYRYRLGFEPLCREVADSITWRRFARIGLGGTVPTPLSSRTARPSSATSSDRPRSVTVLLHACDGCSPPATPPRPAAKHSPARGSAPLRLHERCCWRAADGRARSDDPIDVRPSSSQRTSYYDNAVWRFTDRPASMASLTTRSCTQSITPWSWSTSNLRPIRREPWRSDRTRPATSLRSSGWSFLTEHRS